MLDIRMAVFVGSSITLTFFLIMVSLYLRRITYDGFLCWVAASFGFFLGSALVGLRNTIPDVFSIIVGGSLLLVSFMLITCGMLKFTGITWPNRYIIALPALAYIPISLYFTYVTNSVDARIVTTSIISSLYMAVSCYLSLKYLPRVVHIVNWPITTIFALLLAINIIRMLFTIIADYPLSDFMQYPTSHSVFLILLMVLSIAVFTELIILNIQRVEYDLHASREEVRILRGILPICSHCKKIRDEQGNWYRLEAYIEKHSEAAFSHGICPECKNTYYPES